MDKGAAPCKSSARKFLHETDLITQKFPKGSKRQNGENKEMNDFAES
jgi:hypothetical protein